MKDKKYSTKTKALSIVMNIIGVVLFLLPIHIDGKWTIMLGVIADYIMKYFSDFLPPLVVTIGIVSTILFIIQKILKTEIPFLKMLDEGFVWTTIKLIGFTFLVMAYFKVGPEWIVNEDTGLMVLNDVLPVLIVWFFLAGFLMPILLNFGLTEFIGVLLSKVIRPLFKAPGRSGVDAVASWMGAAPIGVLITLRQYEEGLYTQKEATAIATNFSVVSIPFSLVMTKMIGMEHMFLQIYGAMVVASIVTAVVMVRIPPVSWKSDEYLVDSKVDPDETIPEDCGMIEYAVNQMFDRAEKEENPFKLIKEGTVSVFEMWFNLTTVIMALATLAMIAVEFTPLFYWLSLPLQPILQVFGMQQIDLAGPALLVGFPDIFLGPIVGSGIEDEFTRFIIAATTMAQLIYMADIGALLLKSKLNINFFELVLIFVLRTIIAFPVIFVIAKLVFMTV